MNIKLVHDLKPYVPKMTFKIFRANLSKEIYIALGGFGTDILSV